MLGLAGASQGLTQSALAARGTARSGDSTNPTLLLLALENASYQSAALSTGTALLTTATTAYKAW